MKNLGGMNDLDYIRILQCFYGYILPEPIEPRADAEEVTSLLSELTLKNLSPDSAEEQKQVPSVTSEEENVL